MKKIVLGACAVCAWSVFGVELASPFKDGAVLQRGRPVPVWGTAEAGEKVTVSFAGATVSATADAQGAWRVALPAMKASKESRELVVRGAKDAKTVKDVLVGEVWIASGQSNMEMRLWGGSNRFSDEGGAVLSQFVRRPLIRFFCTANYKWSVTPVKTTDAKWVSLAPENVGGTSAVAFYFAEGLNRELDVPVGVVAAYWGGTNIDAWTPREGYDLHPELAPGKYPVTANWNPSLAKGAISGGCQQPTVIYNAQLAPVAPFAVRGAIWYQGEHNTNHEDEVPTYAARMHALHDGWKKTFENPDFKLYFVQIAQYWCGDDEKRLDRWFDVQRQQEKFAEEEPNAGMAVTSDVRSWKDVHPRSKLAVARRLLLLALKRDYGFADVVCDSPVFEKATRLDNGDVKLEFKHAPKGWYVYNDDFSQELSFELRDADGVWHPAQVRNLHKPTYVWDGASGVGKDAHLVIGWAPGAHVFAPKGVRYMRAPRGRGNLYTDKGLPVGPFVGEVR
ncbi:MAG: hypothetical protein MJ138_06140 [Kiritimatiellae bacterium]|nr:hypothetical protein [Kiritimatiellia bacterium]